MELTITLRTGDYPPGEPDQWQRLRKLLKALLRTYGLRCIDISRLDTDDSGQTNKEKS